jgi:hypothetical protein
MKPERNPEFAATVLLAKCKGVGRTIAAGPPPKWLVRALIRFSLLVGARKLTAKDLVDDNEKMLRAARDLAELLPTYTIADDELGLGLEVPDCVETTLIQLPELIEFLESQLPPSRLGGHTPDGRRLLCAGICAEAYRALHDKLHLHSGVLRQACEDYWLACGNPATGTKPGADVRDNWRTPLEEHLRVMGGGDDWIRSRMELYLTGRK